jgi:hypothetical protein
MQSLRKRLEALDWALFDKDKILKLLNEYSQWTERLSSTYDADTAGCCEHWKSFKK